MRPTVFLDRDGTLNREAGFVTRAADLDVLPGARGALQRLHDAGYRLVVVTNQSGIARGLLDEHDLAEIHERLRELLAREGARLDAILHCPHHPDEGEPPLRCACACRKPAPGLLLEAARRFELDLGSSWIVGDGLRDLEAGARAGLAGAVLVLTGKGRAELAAAPEPGSLRTAPDLPAAARLILAEAPAAPARRRQGK